MSGNRTDDPLYQNVMGDDPNEIPDTPAYQVLKKANLLCTKYRLQSAQEIEAIPQNSDPWTNCGLRILLCPCSCLFTTFETPSGYVSLVEDGRGNFNFHAAGVHRIMDPFQRLKGTESFGVNQITHGDRNIVVIYLLNHKNWKFKKFVSNKIQTNVMQQIRATSADNVLLLTNATVIWFISLTHSLLLSLSCPHSYPPSPSLSLSLLILSFSSTCTETSFSLVATGQADNRCEGCGKERSRHDSAKRH